MTSKKLKVAFIEAGRTQKEVAREIGINEGLLSLAVNGRYLLDEGQKRKLAIALGKPVKDLFGDQTEAI
jgi:transcriptional regulator with XRE-family HTH domain